MVFKKTTPPVVSKMDINLDSDILLTKVDVNNRPIYVKILWKQTESDLFHIKIFEDNKSWSGRYSAEFAEKYRERVDETEENYVRNARLFLSGDSDMCEFDFTKSTSDIETATFIWKKKFKGSTATQVHGSVPVHLNAIPESKDTLIDYLLAENKGLQLIIADLNNKSETIKADLEKCRIEMENFVEIKCSLEANLYGKFLQLLNAKKKRISLLEEHIEKSSQP